jgi:thioredoxin 1
MEQAMPVNVDTNTFERDVLQADRPVLVDFWADWCGPCKMIAPHLESLEQELGDKLTVAKLDVDSNQQIAMQYGIRGIPTLMLFKDGALADQRVGALSKNDLESWIKSAVQ